MRLWVSLVALLLFVAPLSPQPAPLRLAERIALPDVKGRIDHLAFDPDDNRLFVAALGNDTVEVVDLARNQRVASIPGQHEPQGLAYLPRQHALVVANGQGGAVRFYDARTLKLLREVPVVEDADNVRVDARDETVYVGYGSGAIAAIASDGGKIAEVAVGGHPESFQLEPGGSRIFVNVPTTREVVVVDRVKKTVVARWPLADVSANYPMALDADGRRLFVAARRPARLLVLDTSSGKVVGQTEIVGDCDDIFYDAERRRLYVIGGGGAITVVADDGKGYAPLATVPTTAGARTGLWVNARQTLYVAVPARGSESAEIRAFAP